MQRIYAVVLSALVLAACGGMPQSAEEFRKAVPGAMMTKTDTYEVNRSMQAVGATFRQRAPECLGVQVRTVSQTTTSYQNILTTYKPTVVRQRTSAPSCTCSSCTKAAA